MLISLLMFNIKSHESQSNGLSLDETRLKVVFDQSDLCTISSSAHTSQFTKCSYLPYHAILYCSSGKGVIITHFFSFLYDFSYTKYGFYISSCRVLCRVVVYRSVGSVCRVNVSHTHLHGICFTACVCVCVFLGLDCMREGDYGY